ncbi:MAG: dephospho-CoA kinase [Alphaproteobacteria bacterium]|jgi:dephospho-CoA kinase|nr:dephospho-CoA kinase [Alphaproteobacteria bacterium]
MDRLAPIVIGVTGSIGAGKSTVSKCLVRKGAKRLDTDRVVHGFLKRDGDAYKKVATLFPSSVTARGISRKKLGALVFGNPSNLQRLENILHPLVIKACKQFIKEQGTKGKHVVVLEVPLLFETGLEKLCTYTLFITTTEAQRRKRVLSRPNMTEEKYQAITKKMGTDRQRQKRADFVVSNNSDDQEALQKKINSLWKKMMNREDV